jgi:hypothetical protein
MKNERIELLKKILLDLEIAKNEYIKVSPAWILINTAQGHVKSLHHLEAETSFDEETLGVVTDA